MMVNLDCCRIACEVENQDPHTGSHAGIIIDILERLGRRAQMSIILEIGSAALRIAVCADRSW